jgi:hypothetical protein
MSDVRCLFGYQANGTRDSEITFYKNCSKIFRRLIAGLVPALAFASQGPIAAGLVVTELVGRGIRKPIVEAMLSYAGKSIGAGWAFAFERRAGSGGSHNRAFGHGAHSFSQGRLSHSFWHAAARHSVRSIRVTGSHGFPAARQ